MRPTGNLCGSTKKNGEPCEAEAGKGTDHLGFGTCKHHLGRSENHEKAAAKEEAVWRARVDRLVEPALDTMEGLLDAKGEGVQLGAAKDLLDRAGVKVKDEDAGEQTINIIMDLRELD